MRLNSVYFYSILRDEIYTQAYDLFSLEETLQIFKWLQLKQINTIYFTFILLIINLNYKNEKMFFVEKTKKVERELTIRKELL